MIREDRFLISRRPYAINLNSLHTDPNQGGSYWWSSVEAVWFRRHTKGYGTDRRTITVACIGTLRDLQAWQPDDVQEFLRAFDDGRYGGRCEGRWDGERYWGAQEPDVMEQHLAVLRPMLDNYPTIPAGHDGWWRF